MYEKVYESIKNGVLDFGISSEISTQALSADGSIIAEYNISEMNSDQIYKNFNINLTQVHLYSLKQSERFGGKYMYFCPLGFAYSISPVISDGKTIGALVCGPMLIIDENDFFSEITMKYSSETEILDQIKQFLKNIQTVSPEKLKHLSNLLFYVAQNISDLEYMQFLNTEIYSQNNSEINTEISVLKRLMKSEAEYPIFKEKELFNAISQGNKQTSQRLLNELLGFIFFSTGGNIKIIKTRVIELLIQLSRAAIFGGAIQKQVFDMNVKCLDQLERLKTLDDISIWLSQVMVRFTDLVFKFTQLKHADVIQKVINFININYMNYISLEIAAKEVHLSSAYLSKIFNNEMHCNFNLYLNRFRIEKSKILLLDNNITMVDIPSQVGFEEQSYFSKVFKKIVGITPGKFRKNRGHFKSENEIDK